MNRIPYLEGKGKDTTLYVDGKPFVALSGEIHNSSSSCLNYMENIVWPALRPLNMNCVIMPVYWECVEPEEGVFDFTLVDGLIDQARRENVKVVFLWFGLWKNGMSTYVPGWVKNDSKKYFRVRKGGSDAATARLLPGGGSNSPVIDCISPLCVEAYKADARAFSALMRHMRYYDSEHSTVIIMQVENEMACSAPPATSPIMQTRLLFRNPAGGSKGIWVKATSPRISTDADNISCLIIMPKLSNTL